MRFVIKCHHFKMEKYIPYSVLCDLFSRNLEKYLHLNPFKLLLQRSRLLNLYKFNNSNSLRVIHTDSCFFVKLNEKRLHKISFWSIGTITGTTVRINREEFFFIQHNATVEFDEKHKNPFYSKKKSSIVRFYNKKKVPYRAFL